MKKKRKKSSPIRLIQNKLWELCKKITRLKYGNVCYTCDAKGLVGSNWQTGHLIPKAVCGALMKYDLRILRPQCYNCNINLGGNGAEFMRRMILREGQEYVDAIYKERNVLIKAFDHYEMLVAKYELILEDLESHA